MILGSPGRWRVFLYTYAHTHAHTRTLAGEEASQLWSWSLLDGVLLLPPSHSFSFPCLLSAFTELLLSPHSKAHPVLGEGLQAR